MWMSHPNLPGALKTVTDSAFYGGWDTLGWVVAAAPVGPPQPDAGWPVSRVELDAAMAANDTLESSTFARPNRPRVGFLGDSITAGIANSYDVGTATFYGIGDSPASHAMMASDGRWDFVLNAGIGGQTSAQIAARVQRDIIDTGCTVAVIMSCFWNDQGLGTVTPAQNLATITGMVNTLRAAGVLPVLCLPTPDGRTGSNAARLLWMATATQLVRDYAFRNGIALADTQSPMMDAATGTITVGMNADGSVHPNAAGYKALGLKVQQTLDAFLAPAPDNLVKHALDTTDLLAGKGMFLTNTAGVGTGWGLAAGTAGAAPTITTDSAVLGNLQRLTATATAGNLIYDVGFTGWAVGDTIAIRGIFTGSGGTAKPLIRLVVGGAPVPNIYPNFQPSAPVTRGRFCLLWKVVPGVTSLTLRLQLQAGDGFFEVGQLSVRNLTALGIA